MYSFFIFEPFLDYPTTFKISSIGGIAEFYPEYMGVYTIVPEKYHLGKPVWIHESNQVYFFNKGNEHFYLNL